MGGSINITAGAFSIADGTSLEASSFGNGVAGDILINVRDTFQARNGTTISSTARRSSGGNINVTARTIRLSDDSDITTNIFSGTGRGGNITLAAESIVALNDSDILAFARDGQGGNITLNTRAFFGQNYRPGSSPPFDGNRRVDIDASGTISGIISLPDVSFLQNSLTEFSQNLVDVSTLLTNSCIVRTRQQVGSFFITGSDGLPERPGEAPISAFPTGEVRSVKAEGRGQRAEGQKDAETRGHGDAETSIQNSKFKIQNSPTPSWKIGDPIVEPQGVYQLPNGQLVMSRECRD
ncbi:hypothetical protein K9N68_29235 [Kovacikia minuta CCNUW1]|uniref:hypothetical protein n=1 Tax=Kovacikia minuta TaxID=2931930 RepID=UPI001CC9F755|nr:hypothetical protein [Kovacikia minuta]UBF25608.1 hypothetical protein K9N68_29235 [Kovacikia minuta CCNUW1]